ncbi:MAG TPA: LiaF domain-containing protein [Polyangia bacterium]|nr:LiaF domain-containing protein [Polyangia bacterium]
MPSDDERPPGPTTLARRDARVERAELERARTARDRAIAALSDAFAHDVLDVEEFERRVTVAHTSEASAEILALIADLPASTDAIARVPVALAQAEPTTIGEAATTQTVYAIMGGVDRRGAWTVPQRWRVIAMMGGAQLDLREARFPAGVIDLEVKAVFGGVQIIVPPGLAVEVHGTAIMGGFQNVNRAPAHPDPDAPLLRVHGIAIMGGVDIHMRLPGENDRAARRRQRIEDRDARRALRDERRGQRALDRRRDDDR